jgi:helicase
MLYRLVFIGVDQYSDPQIRELSGAANDARALWSLFTDTFPSADSHLLINECATRDAVRGRIENAMIEAEADDVAMVFFGGHGTRDHQLVLHDTVRSDLPSSTISMREIAELFRRTTARTAILILDCCFSGGVTARVIEDSPLSRDLAVPFSDIAGAGRVIITASKFDEPAYELPGHDHGVLSKALVDALLAGEHNSVPPHFWVK